MKNFKSLFIIAITLLTTLGLQAQRQGGANLDPNVKGMNVTYVEYNGGSFKQTADKKWGEFNASGNKTNNFDETGRDEWSVYMVDNNRGGMKLSLDLWQKTVKVDGNPIYQITKISAADAPKKINGQNVQSVVYKGGSSFAAIGNGKWGEFNASGSQTNSFDETGRDEWSVYLIDRSRNGMKIALDLWQKKVKIDGTPYYVITDVSTEGHSSPTPPTPKPDPNPNPTQGKVTFKNIDNKNIIVEVFKEIGTREPKFVSRLTPGKSVSVDCNIGDSFSFIPVSQGFEALPYVVTKLNVTHDIVSGQRYANSKNTYKRIPNADANRHSFDIFKIDPIYIDYTKNDVIRDKAGKEIGRGGMRKQIFKSLDDLDIDWTPYDGDIALKNQFGLKVLGELEESEETKMYYNASTFKQSFAANIGVSGGKEEKASAGGSASFGYSTSESKNQTQIYTYTRAEGKIYDITLQKEHAQLTDDFKSAIMSLPKPGTTPRSLSAAKSTSGFSSYKNFIRTWGTHYPVKASYGGIKVGMYTFSEKQFKESKGWSIDVKGEAKKGVKVEGGGSYSQDKSFEEMSSGAKKMFRYKGGGGSGEGWAVDMDNSQAIGVDLKRLYELATAYYFKDGTSNSDLEGRKAMLKYALEDYIGAATDAGKSLKPRFYQIYDVQWKMVEEEDGTTTPNIYGNVAINVKKDGKSSPVTWKRVFSRSDAARSRVVAEKGYIEECPGDIVFSVPASGGSMNVNPYYFYMDAALYDYDKSSENDNLGHKSTKIYFNKIGTSPQTITAKVRSDDGDIDVTAKVREINLGFDGF